MSLPMTNERKDVVGVILAGGLGTRMAPFSNKFPKPILPICNKPLIEYQLETMQQIGIKKVFIVIGHLGYEISSALGTGSHLDLQITYVEQVDKLGIAHALGQLQSYIDTPFLLFLGDIFFQTFGLKELLDKFISEESGAYLVVKNDIPEAIAKNFSVILDQDTELVQRVIEKPRYIHNPLKGCGLYLFDLTVFDAIRRTPRTAMRDEYEITDSIQILIDDGEPVRIAHVVEKDINLTNPYDLFTCNMFELKKRKLDNLIDPSAEISDQVSVTNSIIGPNVKINGQVNLKNCVIFADTVIDRQNGLIQNYIVTPDIAVDCQQPIIAK